MILLVHLLFGAAIGSMVKNVPPAIILAFLSHYFLDLFPHVEYPIKNITEKNWKRSLLDFLKILIDFTLGALLVFLLSPKTPLVFICAFFAILPDGLTVLSAFSSNKFFGLHNNLHRKKIHFLKYKKISGFWRINSQILITIISIVLLLKN